MKYRLLLLCCVLMIFGACSCWDGQTWRSQSPDELEEDRSKTRVVGDMAVPFGLFPVKIEAVGLVTGLPGTGSDPAPSPQRAALLAEMQTRGVTAPNTVLASKNTALVLIRAVLRPGIQKGDHFDLEVRIPSRSETTSLRGGWLLETRLKELAILGNQVRDGHVLGIAQGPVLVDPSADIKEDRVLSGRGRILGGGMATKSRSMGLVLKPEYQNVLNSSRIANAVNKRFHTFQNGLKVGVAKAKTEEYVDLAVHPRYKDNIRRYVQVVRAVALRESAAERVTRLKLLEKQLFDPVTAGAAARQLEAVGHQGIEVLSKGILSKDREVRFYSAEALAYLDQTKAAEPLAEAAREEPAFRVFALTALSAMDDFTAYDELRKLLNGSSAETRYGAFRALWAMRPDDPLVLGEPLGGQFSYHVLSAGGTPMIHVTRNRRPEIVLFGQDQRLHGPLAVEAGTQIMVTSTASGEISVAKYSIDEQDQKRIVSNRVDDVIRAIVELGGTYPDVVQALQEVKSSGALTSRFEVDALPEAGRRYDRVAADEDAKSTPDKRLLADNPLPDLFTSMSEHRSSLKSGSGGKAEKKSPSPADSDRNSHPVKAFFAKMVGRSSE